MSEVRSLLHKAEDRGFSLIEGLFDSKSESVYWIIALCKHPEKWEPYKAPRHFGESDTFALAWYLDEELTSANMRGEMIYTEPDPWDYEPGGDNEEGEDPPEVNQETHYVLSVEEVADRIDELEEENQQEILAILRGLFLSSDEKKVAEVHEASVVPDRWNSAVRID